MKLKKISNCFYINRKKKFRGIPISSRTINSAFEFAFNMAFGKGYHRKNRSGGDTIRNATDIFKDTFQGKLAEIILFHYFHKNDVFCKPIDFSISGKGIWDDCDLIVYNKKISVKSTSFFSNLLLLETKDFNKNGQYMPNISTPNTIKEYNYFILVRIKPHSISSYSKLDKSSLKNEISKYNWHYDIAGWCSLKTLKYIIKNNYILPKHSLLNGKTKMDAENYYIQTGDLKSISELIKLLKK